jgi:hypothetical protein
MRGYGFLPLCSQQRACGFLDIFCFAIFRLLLDLGTYARIQIATTATQHDTDQFAPLRHSTFRTSGNRVLSVCRDRAYHNPNAAVLLSSGLICDLGLLSGMKSLSSQPFRDVPPR